ncbi:MAG: twin-arginine translocase subunit TatC [Deltaproteobacteria bacterium]|nr:twin-arginine translocase subunit TatC [Deltaproteobacteria bacterium]
MDPNKYTLTEHLTELRARLVLSMIAVVVTTVGALIFAPELLAAATRPLTHVLELSNRVVCVLVAKDGPSGDLMASALERTGRAEVRARLTSIGEISRVAAEAKAAKRPVDLVFVAEDALPSDGSLASDSLAGVDPPPSVAYLVSAADAGVQLRLMGEDASVIVAPPKLALVARVVRKAAVAAGKKEKAGLAVLSPFDYFVAYLKIALVVGLFLACPIWLLQTWRFVEPGLFPQEKKLVGPIITSGSLLFLAGGAFSYFAMFPLMFDVLVNQLMPDAVIATFTLDSYLSLLLQLTLVFGIVFETPLIIALLAMLGIVTPVRLRKFRRYWIVLSFIVAAVLTPADPFSQTAMAVPLVVFYEVGIIAATVMAKRRARATEANATAS